LIDARQIRVVFPNGDLPDALVDAISKKADKQSRRLSIEFKASRRQCPTFVLDPGVKHFTHSRVRQGGFSHPAQRRIDHAAQLLLGRAFRCDRRFRFDKAEANLPRLLFIGLFSRFLKSSPIGGGGRRKSSTVSAFSNLLRDKPWQNQNENSEHHLDVTKFNDTRQSALFVVPKQIYEETSDSCERPG